MTMDLRKLGSPRYDRRTTKAIGEASFAVRHLISIEWTGRAGTFLNACCRLPFTDTLEHRSSDLPSREWSFPAPGPRPPGSAALSSDTTSWILAARR